MFYSQICQSVSDQTTKSYLEFYEYEDLNTYVNGNDAIIDINPDFVEDVRIILKKFDNNTFVTGKILDLVNDFS